MITRFSQAALITLLLVTPGRPVEATQAEPDIEIGRQLVSPEDPTVTTSSGLVAITVTKAESHNARNDR